MERVVIVTDSSATVPATLAEKLDIRIVPIILALNGHSYRDGVDLQASDIYRWLRGGGRPPTTSAPSVGDFVRTYAAAAQQATGIVSIHLPKKLSSTFNAALTASRLINGMPIQVMDCHSAAMGQGFVVLEAARAASTGADMETVMARARQVADSVHLLATIGTLEHLQRGGRVSAAAALVGSMLKIKPVFSLTRGQIKVFTRARSLKRALDLILKQMEDQVGNRPVHAAILHGDALEQATELGQRVAARFDCIELYVTELTPVMGAHTGPGVLGVVFYADDKGPSNLSPGEGD